MMSQLGSYQDFPAFVHYVLSFKVPVLPRSVANLITRGLSRLNDSRDSVQTSVAGHLGMLLVERAFEVGIAEGLCFNYLDEHEVVRFSQLSPQPKLIDFIVYISYRYSRGQKVANLLPDRYLVRFSLGSRSLSVFHMGGLRRTSPEDLARVIIAQINLTAKSFDVDSDLLVADTVQS